MIRVIAHEVNNSMAGVNSMLSTARLMLSDSSDDYADLGRSGQRMRGPLPVYEQIYNRFCRCGENPEASLKPTDLNSR